MEYADIEFSVVIPTYNRAHLLPRAIESVLSQDFPPSQIIIIDDGSNDNSGEVLRKYASKIHLIYQDNAGSAAARHRGIMAATKNWIAMLDSDDMWLPDHLDRMRVVIEATNGRANYYFSDTRRTKLDGYRRHWEIAGFEITEPYVLTDHTTHWLLARRLPMMLQSSVLKRAAYLECGGFLTTLRYRDDSHLFIKLGLNRAICAVAGVGAVMTADDNPNNRLSVLYNDQIVGKQMKILMSQDLLAYFGERLTYEQKRLLTVSLIRAHLGLVRATLRERDMETIRELVRSYRPLELRHLIGNLGSFLG